MVWADQNELATNIYWVGYLIYIVVCLLFYKSFIEGLYCINDTTEIIES